MPWPFPRPVSKGSGRVPNIGFGWIPDSLPAGPSLSLSVEQTEKVWWFSLLSSHLRIHFWLGDRILSTFGVKRLSWGFANELPNIEPVGFKQVGVSYYPHEPYLSQLPFLTIGAASLLFLLFTPLCFPPSSHCFPILLGSRRKGLTAQGHSLLGTACAYRNVPWACKHSQWGSGQEPLAITRQNLEKFS